MLRKGPPVLSSDKVQGIFRTSDPLSFFFYKARLNKECRPGILSGFLDCVPNPYYGSTKSKTREVERAEHAVGSHLPALLY